MRRSYIGLANLYRGLKTPNSDPLMRIENVRFMETGSVIPRRLIGGLHEWRNDSPTVPIWDLVNSLPGE